MKIVVVSVVLSMLHWIYLFILLFIYGHGLITAAKLMWTILVFYFIALAISLVPFILNQHLNASHIILSLSA